jgi:hypothetical protein
LLVVPQLESIESDDRQIRETSAVFMGPRSRCPLSPSSDHVTARRRQRPGHHRREIARGTLARAIHVARKRRGFESLLL